MNREKILAILYEMSIVIGGETRLRPLLTKTLQRFLFHTSFPCGMIFLETTEERDPEYARERSDVELAMSIGDFELASRNGSPVSVPTAIIRGGPELVENPVLVNSLHCRTDYYRFFLRLPLDDCGVMVLLSPSPPASDLPLTMIFQPVLSNLAKAILLCQSNEAYTESIISDRKRAEAENRQLASIVESSDDAIIGKSLEGMILSWNKGAENLYGFTADEIKGRPISALIPPECPDDVPEILEKIRRGIHVDHYETLRLRKDGKRIHVSLTVSPVKNDAGQVIGASAIARDISDKKQAEQELKRANAYNRSLIEASLDPLVTIGPDGSITDVNAATEAATGRSRSELIGTDFSEYFTDRGEARAGYQQVFREGSVRDYPLEIRHREGGTTPVLYNASLYRDEAGQVIGVFAAARDITARRKLEEQLRQSQKMEAVGQLAGGISHDFNNILTAIIGYGAILQRKMDLADPLRQHVDQVLESANRAAALTRSLLAFSRKQIMDLKQIDLSNVILRMEKFLRRIIGEDIDLTVTSPPEPLIVLADSGQIEQVLMNLATNGRDAMSRGGRLTIATSPVAMDESFRKMHGYGKPGPYALLSVTDTGSGMSEAVRDRIFEPFFTTKETGKGTGLGMSIVYGIVKQHNGYINVYSEPGRGTTFRVYLPRIASLEETANMPREQVLPSGGTETILVAEDDAAVRHLTRSLLEEFGYKVLTAEDGDAAVACFREHADEVRLCILDMIMPKKRGREVCDEITRLRPGVEVLFTSGYTLDTMSREGILDLGFDYVLKPVTPSELLKKVRDALDRRRTAAS